MRRALTIIAAAIAFAVASTASANATTLTWTSPLTIDSHDIVGIAGGLAGDNPGSDAILIAQHLLDMFKSTSETYNGRLYETSDTEYSGILTSGGKTDCGYCVVSAGWQWAIAKYAGQNAGWILFHLGGNEAILPQYSYSIWGNNPAQYQISDVTVFDPVRVPDGGSTAALLGSALFALGILRRKFSGR
jgi:protein with PEP-CTERM/exosortase system signal